MILPMGAELRIEALGAPHSPGTGTIPGHSSKTYSTNRFEQPIRLRGNLYFGNDEHDFAGRGERDHSWGPRAWNSYLHRETSQDFSEVDYRFAFNDDEVTRPVAGTFSVKPQDGSVIAGRIDPISGTDCSTRSLIHRSWPAWSRGRISARQAAGSSETRGPSPSPGTSSSRNFSDVDEGAWRWEDCEDLRKVRKKARESFSRNP
jgi:hypothetical protein